MKPAHRLMVRISFGIPGALVLILAALWIMWWASSLPESDATFTLHGLDAPVRIDYDRYGIPGIQANNRLDAMHALGFVTARDRLSQMDLMRRSAAGRLAEIFGAAAVEDDRWHRVMGFEHLAAQVLAGLPDDQRSVLEAYAEGVNQGIHSYSIWPFEFLALGYEPEAWRPEDSVLIILGLFEVLSWSADRERMQTVMEAALPPGVARFLTPYSDPYTQRLLKEPSADEALPVTDLNRLLHSRSKVSKLVDPTPKVYGSNAWLVSGAKTRDGNAILANDMHLELTVPNIWYRAQWRYADRWLSGLTVPGLPLLVSGSNGQFAWGLTNIEGDFVDLVRIRADSRDPMRYFTEQGFRQFQTRKEIIRIRGGAAEVMEVKTTHWGPLEEQTLLGSPVAVHWTALDAESVNLYFMHLETGDSVQEAIDIVNRSGGPPLNILLADRDGHIAWTLSGRIPKRFGLDGTVSREWNATRGWDGYLAPSDLPRIVDPASGFLVSANQRMLPRSYPTLIGQAYEHGYRAWRIAERLETLDRIEERDLLELQLDTRSEFYDFYRDVAVTALQAAGNESGQTRANLLNYLQGWKGHANSESLGLPLLVEFREQLVDRLLSPLLARCRAVDPGFTYRWPNLDLPLQRLLADQPRELPGGYGDYPDWNTLIVAILEQSVRKLEKRHGVAAVEGLHWGQENRVVIGHPFAKAIPWLSGWLDMPTDPLPGCSYCVRVAVPGFGASARMVVSPGHEDRAILHMPAGQSGHPLSSHYQDQQDAWLKGLATAMTAGKSINRLQLNPPIQTP